MGGQHEALPNIKQYGAYCAAWDNIAGTPWHDSCHMGDMCSMDYNWCSNAWCYVDPKCDSFVPTSVFADVPGAPESLGYSYTACGSHDCYDGTTGCPHDPNGQFGCDEGETTYALDARCKCIGIDPQWYMGGKHEDLPNIAQYGSSCNAWDNLDGTPWFADYCYMKDMCSADNWCMGKWCYVDSSCPSFVSTSVFADVPGAPESLGYSYEACGSKDCYADPEALGCPDDTNGQFDCFCSAH